MIADGGRAARTDDRGPSGQPLDGLADAFLAEPSDVRRRDQFVASLAREMPSSVSANVDQALDTLAGDDAVDLHRLVPTVMGAVCQEPAVARALRVVADVGELTSDDITEELYRPLSRPLTLRLLRDAVVASDDVETLLTALRRRWLLAAVADERIVWPGLDLLAAVALQMLTTEWVFDETLAETHAVRDLQTTLHAAGTMPLGSARTHLLIYALYRPLESVVHEAPAAIDQAKPAALAELLRRHLVEPAEERRLAARLPRMTPITDPVSVQVQAQYGTLPYPRWQSVPRRSPRPVGELVAHALNRPDLRSSVTTERPRVLIAGCGTGRHAISAATRYAGSRVLAIDLSLEALGFAARQARRLGVRNIDFAQADILELADLDDRFDVIESSGVLHHLRQPETGWEILRGLLNHRGLMKIALYSRSGRSVLDTVRDQIRIADITPTIDGIRSLRRAVRGLPSDLPARQLTAGPDFYSVTGCRDLLFNVHEDLFDLPRIATALETLDLEFLGFELADRRIRTLFWQHFPDDPLAVDLQNWHRLERRYRYLFASMYRFWCQATPSG